MNDDDAAARAGMLWIWMLAGLAAAIAFPVALARAGLARCPATGNARMHGKRAGEDANG